MNRAYVGIGAALILVVVMNKEKIIIKGMNGYDSLFQKYGAENGVDWQLLKKIAYIESTLGLNPRVVRGLVTPSDVKGSASYDGLSWGIMQLRPSTAQQFDPAATPEKLNNAEYSINIGAQYVAWVQRFIARKIGADNPRYLEFVVKSYNQGVGNSSKEIQTGKGYADAYFDKFKKVSV